MTEPSNDTLKSWLEAFTVDIELAQLKRYQTALTHVLSKATKRRSLDLVLLACGAASDEDVKWFDALVRAKNPDLPANNRALLETLACAALVKCFKRSVHDDDVLLLALGVRSATFVGLTPVLPEVRPCAEASLAAAAVKTRERTKPWNPVSSRIQAIVSVSEVVDPSTGQPYQRFDGIAEAIAELGDAIDTTNERFENDRSVIDEEYDALWWSHLNSSTTDDLPWEKVKPPARRAVLVADELGRQVKRIPAPPIVAGLAELALGKGSDSEVSIGELAQQCVAVDATVAGRKHGHRLLPISTAVGRLVELVDPDATWTKLLDRSDGVDTEHKSSASEAVKQLFREVEIGSLLDG
jgi:hypothetical protein